MTTEELARLVLDLLADQEAFFRSKSPQMLQVCKDKERRLKRLCREVLNPPMPSLFDGLEGGEVNLPGGQAGQQE